MEGAGNQRPTRSSPLRKRTDDQSGTICLQDLIELRDDMKTAYEKYVQHETETVCKPRTVVDDLKFYAVKLIGHLHASGTKEQLQHVISDIVNELREDAETMWDPLSIDGKQCMETSVEVQQLKECLVEIKRQKRILEETLEELQKSSLMGLTEEPYTGYMKRNTTYTHEQRKIEKRKLSEEMHDLVQQQDTMARMFIDQQNELQEIKEDFISIWHLISDETEANRQGTSGHSENNPNIKEMRDFIVFNIKRLKMNREKFVFHAACLLKGIWNLVTNEPFQFSIPTNVNNEDIVKGIHPHLHSAIKSINCLFQCLKENSKRLSQLSGANLTEDNPDIAELSDPNRPTKLAEKYSELYEYHWTDAFEILEISDDRRRIDFLLEILVESYNVCRAISQNQLEILTKGMLSPSEGVVKENATKLKEDRKLSKVQLKALTELRKLSADTAVEDVKLHIAEEHTEWVRGEEAKKYTMQCIELCWLMHVQSPPVYLDANVVPGSTFHSNQHRQYTKSGTKLDYLVWPTLLLHEGGPVLCKGVAQGK